MTLRISCVWPLAAALLALGVCSAELRAEDRERPARKAELLRGTVEEVGDGRVVVRTADGKDVKLAIDDASDLRLDGRAARPGDFKKGTRVRVRYETRDGKNHVVLMRTPGLVKALAGEARDMVRTLRDYGFDKREEYRKKLSVALSDLDERIDDLQDRIADSGADARRRGEVELRELQAKREKVREQLERVKTATAENWPTVRNDLSNALDDLHRAYEHAREGLK